MSALPDGVPARTTAPTLLLFNNLVAATPAAASAGTGTPGQHPRLRSKKFAHRAVSGRALERKDPFGCRGRKDRIAARKLPCSCRSLVWLDGANPHCATPGWLTSSS